MRPAASRSAAMCHSQVTVVPSRRRVSTTCSRVLPNVVSGSSSCGRKSGAKSRSTSASSSNDRSIASSRCQPNSVSACDDQRVTRRASSSVNDASGVFSKCAVSRPFACCSAISCFLRAWMSVAVV